MFFLAGKKNITLIFSRNCPSSLDGFFLGSECTAMKPLFCKKNEIKHLRSSCQIFRFKDLKLRSIFLFKDLGSSSQRFPLKDLRTSSQDFPLQDLI